MDLLVLNIGPFIWEGSLSESTKPPESGPVIIKNTFCYALCNIKTIYIIMNKLSLNIIVISVLNGRAFRAKMFGIYKRAKSIHKI